MSPAVGFASWELDWQVDRQKANARVNELRAALQTYVPEARWHDLIDGFEDAASDPLHLEHQWFFEALLLHLPGLAPALRLLRSHIMEDCWRKPVECGGDSCRGGY